MHFILILLAHYINSDAFVKFNKGKTKTAMVYCSCWQSIDCSRGRISSVSDLLISAIASRCKPFKVIPFFVGKTRSFSTLNNYLHLFCLWEIMVAMQHVLRRMECQQTTEIAEYELRACRAGCLCSLLVSNLK